MPFACWLLIVHTLGIVLATCFAVIDFPSVVVSGPLLSGSGVLIALISYRRDRVVGFLFGLATPTLSMSCVVAISLLNLSPGRAREPVCTLLVLFSMASGVACATALGELRSASAGNDRRYPLQYSIGGLLLLMLAFSGALSLGRSMGAKAATSAFFVIYVIALIYVLDKFFTSRRLWKLSETSSFLDLGPAKESLPGSQPDSQAAFHAPEDRKQFPRHLARSQPPYATRFMTRLLIAQAIAILVAVVFAVIDIESIVASGPILSVSGALIGQLSFGRDRLLGLFFGMSAPTLAAFCLFVIATLEWDPSDAQIPVGALLVVFGLLSVPACALSVQELHTSGNAPRTHFQFSIAAVLVLTLVLAITLGLAQRGGKGIAVGVSLGYLVVLLYVLNQFFRNRRQKKLVRVSSFLAPKRKA